MVNVHTSPTASPRSATSASCHEGGVHCIHPSEATVFIDAGAFLPHIPQGCYPADGSPSRSTGRGLRGIGLGAWPSERGREDGSPHLPELELYRLAINRRSYTNST